MLLKPSTCFSLAALCAFVAADFPLAAWDGNGAHMVWYGDGNLYVGSTVPAEIKVAFNFTILEPRNSNFDFWFLNPSVSDSDLPPTLHLEQRPFLAIRPSQKSSPMFFTDDIAKFLSPAATSTITASSSSNSGSSVVIAYTWMHYQSMAIPLDQSGNPVMGSAYLADTSEDGTYVVVWDVERKADVAGMRMVNLLTTMGE